MTKRKPWSEGRKIMRKQIDRTKREIKREIDRKGQDRQKGKETPK